MWCSPPGWPSSKPSQPSRSRRNCSRPRRSNKTPPQPTFRIAGFFVAIRSLDPEGWGSTDSTFFKARVLRALIRVLSDMIGKIPFEQLTTERMRAMLQRIDQTTLSEEEVRRAQG